VRHQGGREGGGGGVWRMLDLRRGAARGVGCCRVLVVKFDGLGAWCSARFAEAREVREGYLKLSAAWRGG
jgi:hypothetical protein